jgi:hypothetical protein
MSKARKNIGKDGLGQLKIFDLIEEVSRKQAEASPSVSTAGKSSIDAAIRAIITASLKRAAGSRYEMAARMSEILGVEITKAMLDSWSAESKENHRFPLVYVAAFCQATGDYSLVRYAAELCGGYYIEDEDALRLALGRIEEEKDRLAKEESIIRGLLDGRNR